jgi:hypothetical protein
LFPEQQAGQPIELRLNIIKMNKGADDNVFFHMAFQVLTQQYLF